MKEPLDRNKTELTHKITALACAYLSILGCKPIETEVGMSDGTIADVASFTYPTMSELKKSKLLKRLTGEEIYGDYKQASLIQYKYGGILTVAVEVKTSVSDFKKDLGRKYHFDKSTHIPAHLCYLAMPKMIIEKIDKINFWRYWSLLTCSNDGERIIKVSPPWYVFPLHPYQVIDLIAQVAIRREHRTSYKVFREWGKMYRAKRNE